RQGRVVVPAPQRDFRQAHRQLGVGGVVAGQPFQQRSRLRIILFPAEHVGQLPQRLGVLRPFLEDGPAVLFGGGEVLLGGVQRRQPVAVRQRDGQPVVHLQRLAVLAGRRQDAGQLAAGRR